VPYEKINVGLKKERRNLKRERRTKRREKMKYCVFS
jgi:hypothetical protein